MSLPNEQTTDLQHNQTEPEPRQHEILPSTGTAPSTATTTPYTTPSTTTHTTPNELKHRLTPLNVRRLSGYANPQMVNDATGAGAGAGTGTGAGAGAAIDNDPPPITINMNMSHNNNNNNNNNTNNKNTTTTTTTPPSAYATPPIYQQQLSTLTATTPLDVLASDDKYKLFTIFNGN
ncbi:Hypothetical predicted protein, partial [Drosophila guanche]